MSNDDRHRVVPPRAGAARRTSARTAGHGPPTAATRSRPDLLAPARHGSWVEHGDVDRRPAHRAVRRLGARTTTSTCSFDRSAIADRWTRAEEAWHVRLRALSGHGSWRGFDVLPALQAGSGRRTDRRHHPGQRALAGVAFVHPRQLDRERRARSAPTGLLGALGMGEAPVGRLGTFSLWRSVDDVASVRPVVAPCRRHAPQPCRGLVPRGAVRPVRAVRQRRARGTASTRCGRRDETAP